VPAKRAEAWLQRLADVRDVVAAGRGFHSSNSHLNLSRSLARNHPTYPTKVLSLSRKVEENKALAADDTESFVLAYGLLVQSAPELGLEPAERLLAAREDIPRATQREVLEECRELLKSRLAQMESVSAAGAGGANAKGKWKAASSKALRFGWMAE